MRITGGCARGRVLSSFKGRCIRPTSEKIREVIFNVIGQDLRDHVVLDLFAGTGILSLEALSRGAKTAVMVDVSPSAIKLIKKNIKLCGFEKKCVIIRHDLRGGVPVSHPALREGVDLIFVDPPYGKGLERQILKELDRVNILGYGGKVIVESAKDVVLFSGLETLRKIFERIYGDTKLTVFERKESEYE